MDNQARYLDEVLQIDYGGTQFEEKVLQLTSVMSPIEALEAEVCRLLSNTAKNALKISDNLRSSASFRM